MKTYLEHPHPSDFPHVMYTPPGFNSNALGDIDVIGYDGKIHLFHLTLPNHDAVGHAISADGLSWQPMPEAIRTGQYGECDDDMIWTMHVVRHPARKLFYMYYTACSTKENGEVQRIAMASSSDLVRWKKNPRNPVLESRRPYYNEDLARVGFISFRDPFVFIDDDGSWHMLIAGRVPSGPRFRSGCVAHAVSRDGLKWKLVKPLYYPSQFEDLEVPSMLKHSGHYALFFNHFCVMDTLCRLSDSLAGPWRQPPRDLLLNRGNCVFRFCEWQGKTLLYTWLKSNSDWPRRGGTSYLALPPPKEVEWDSDTNPVLKSFSGWKRYHRGPARQAPLARFLKRTEGPEKSWIHSADGALRARACGQALTAGNSLHDHFIAEFTLTMEKGRAAGIVFRADEALETAVCLRLDFSAQTAELHQWNIFDSSLRRYKLAQPTMFQSVKADLKHGTPLRVRVLACGEYIEVCLNGVVYISAATYRAKTGRLAFVIEDADAVFSALTIQALTPPLQPT